MYNISIGRVACLIHYILYTDESTNHFGCKCYIRYKVLLMDVLIGWNTHVTTIMQKVRMLNLNKEDGAVKVFGDVKSIEDPICLPPPMMLCLKLFLND